jgi:hypothetical protein
MTKDEIIKLFGTGVPLVLAEVVGEKLNVGSNVNTQTGKTEDYASLSTTLIIGDDVATLRSYARDEATLALYKAADAGDVKAMAQVRKRKRGDRIAIKIYSITREKGSTKVTGDVIDIT